MTKSKPTTSATTNAEKKIREHLEKEINGAHGMSERRYAAQFVLDAMEGNESEFPITQAANLAESLAGFCSILAGDIRRLGPR